MSFASDLKLFDSHAHLYDKRFDGEILEVLKRAKEAGVTGIINVGADMEASLEVVSMADKHDMLYASVGIHPHDAKDAALEDYDKLALWCAKPKVVAVGETGLDYYYNHSPREIQKTVFIRHLDLARQIKMPVIIHDRDAHADVLEIIKKEGKGLTGVFHCFSGSLEMSREVVKLEFYVSFAGPVTFPNAVKLKEVAKSVPLERLLIETDCPYLAPQSYRGKRNEPAYVKTVADEIARLKGISFEEVAEASFLNTRELFGIVD
jgi:TatD DNase family protein